ncbi:hypothetical protein MPSEU_000829600 [Mayamaea pseudoterrestris]|nr:hypothetical protein MPSEU_000829600 [Mayamaea pseudoterrestris]
MRSIFQKQLLLLLSCLIVILPAAASLASSSFKDGRSKAKLAATGLSPTSVSSPSSPPLYQVVSRNKNNGHVESYTFPDSEMLQPLLQQHEQSYSIPTSKKKLAKQQQQSRFRPLGTLKAAFRSTFLPSGYPSKSRQQFLEYCTWSLVQDLTTQLRSVLATQRVLEGVGVGRPGATALSALLNFLCRDGCGMAASLFFTSLAASKFKYHVKQWRLLADVMIDVGITLEVLAVQMPPAYFLAMISVGNMCKAVCGVAAGACGGSINMYWAKGFGNNNHRMDGSSSNGSADISEIQAKFGAQNTVAGSLGLVFSALFARSASQVDLRVLWLIYGCLTALHIFANIKCMRLLALDTFNTLRLKLVVADFLTKASSPDVYSEQALTPAQVTKKEPLCFVGMHQRVSSNHLLPANIPVMFGVSFSEYSRRSGLTPEELRLQLAGQPAYYIAIGGHKRRDKKPCILVALSARASENDQIKAYVHALLLTEAVASKMRQDGATATSDCNVRRRMEMETVTRLNGHLWNDFTRQCSKAGWDLSSNQLASHGFEVVATD